MRCWLKCWGGHLLCTCQHWCCKLYRIGSYCLDTGTGVGTDNCCLNSGVGTGCCCCLDTGTGVGTGSCLVTGVGVVNVGTAGVDTGICGKVSGGRSRLVGVGRGGTSSNSRSVLLSTAASIFSSSILAFLALRFAAGLVQ